MLQISLGRGRNRYIQRPSIFIAACCTWSWVEEAKQFFFLVPAQGSPDSHVANDGARDPWRKPFGSVVAARALLLEDALTLCSTWL
jgi:hypothetical protein